MNKHKEIPAAGFCIIRPDIIKRKEKVPTGNMMCDLDDAMLYRWLDEERFQVHVYGQWRDAESIDFEFLSDEKKIVKNWFKNYHYSEAMEEIETWSAKDLKQFLKLLGYKTWVKDIMITMVKDLARIHAWKIEMTEKNQFLVK